MKSICVFLGSNYGNNPAYSKVAKALGCELAVRGLTCIYGGSCNGLMNELANAALRAGGEVIGITVQALRDREIYHQGLTELHVMPTMHERKNLMVQLADGFIALPGGIGTFEEFFEAYTLSLLGYHTKPCGLLNINGFFDPLEHMLETAKREGFLEYPYQHPIIRSADPTEMVNLMLKSENS